jgi:hypothetical protein
MTRFDQGHVADGTKWLQSENRNRSNRALDAVLARCSQPALAVPGASAATQESKTPLESRREYNPCQN